MWGFLGRSPDSGSHPRNLDQDESDPVILSGPGLKQVPRAPFERRWDKEISGGQEERKVTGRDRWTARKKGERERGHSRISVLPAARVLLRCGDKCPRAGERPPDPVRTPAPGPRPGRTAASQASCPSHLLACSGGLRRAAVRTTGPGAGSGFPEVSEHALGWLLCGVRVGGLDSDSLAPHGVFSFYE